MKNLVEIFCDVDDFWQDSSDVFPQLPSYNRFVERMKSSLAPLCAFLNTRRGQATGISFIDSTPIIACHPKRSRSHKVFKEFAQ